ncbi:hypothetical protein [Aureispira anguillae]|uniref:SprB repeat-containing protein n=1 Tax=Aureispira anguillae TaxID=2864201 RepID=A0A915YLV1_9BACT|nr:hypothetical protein [Aureispira anguillae]BDS15409.1 hypothetical protein AsAng_0061930 [Aureispira anguillae]
MTNSINGAKTLLIKSPLKNALFDMRKSVLILFSILMASSSYGQLVSISTVDTDCGASTGSISLTPTQTGTYSYLWETGASSSSISNLGMGTYRCTVTKDVVVEVIEVSIYRPWDLERFEPNDNTLSIVGNSVTVNPSLGYTGLADQRTHCYDKTPIDIATQTGSVFAKFGKSHPNFPEQISNPDPAAPPKFYLELFETKNLSNPIRIPLWVHDANLKVVTGGFIPEKIYGQRGLRKIAGGDYTGHDYTDGDEFEIRFLGNHQIEVYLEENLIYSATLEQRSTNEYVAAVGFKDMAHLDRRIAYGLRSSFCATMPVIKTVMTNNNKYGATSSIELMPVDLAYVNNVYSYQWSTGATDQIITNLQKGTYTVTMTNATGGTKVASYEIYDKLALEKADPTASILKIVDNSVTCDPALPMQSISDYRTHAYDPTIPIDVVQGGGSVKFRVGAEHPNFPNQHSNTADANAVFGIRLQAATSPLPVPTFFLDYPFQLMFHLDGRASLSDRAFSWAGAGYDFIPEVYYPKGGYEVELRFTGNKVVEVYMGDQLVATKTLTEAIDKYYLMVGFSDAADRQRRIVYDVRTTFKSTVPVSYAELILGGNTGYFQLTDDYLRFRLKQEYGVETGGETIAYKIYPWNRQNPISSSFVLNHGYNNLDLDVSGLAADSYYTLEFKANKKETYILKFKTKS